jgi:heat shock protein HslJ
MLKYIFISVFSLIALKTCKTTPANLGDSQIKVAQAELKGTWQVINMYGIDSLSKKPTLTFDVENKRINGNAGCNRYNANYTIKDSLMTFGPALSTKMYCNNMNIEKQFLGLLKKVSYFKYKNDSLIFFSKQNQKLISSKLAKN